MSAVEEMADKLIEAMGDASIGHSNPLWDKKELMSRLYAMVGAVVSENMEYALGRKHRVVREDPPATQSQ